MGNIIFSLKKKYILIDQGFILKIFIQKKISNRNKATMNCIAHEQVNNNIMKNVYFAEFKLIEIVIELLLQVNMQFHTAITKQSALYLIKIIFHITI